VTRAAGRTSLAYAAAVISIFGWASLYPVAKPVFGEVTPVEVALARATLASAFLAFLSSVSSGKGTAYVLREGRRDWRGVAVVGLISFTGTSMLAMSAQQLLPASVNGLLNNLSPLWIALYTAFAGRARSAPLLVSGSVIAAAGVGAVLLGGATSEGPLVAGPSTWLGVAISLSGSLLIACAQVITRRVVRGRDPLALTAVAAAWGALPLLALLVAGFGGSLAHYGAASAENKLRLLWLGTMSTAFNFALWSFALAHLPVSRVVPFQYLIAPGGILLAVLLLDEPIGVHLLVGTAAILLGIALAQRGAEAT
jgi:drug/metabolite transporter (DMT)-like permease